MNKEEDFVHLLSDAPIDNALFVNTKWEVY